MKILIASSEAVPFVKSGGLADVAGALCTELREMKHDVRLILPLYGKIKQGGALLQDTGIMVRVPVGSRIVESRIFRDEGSAFFLECDEFFARQELYGTPEGDYEDNAARFVFFSRGVLEACKAMGFAPEVIHCNDWQTGLVPLYLRTLYLRDSYFNNTGTVLTIHNMGYQGVFPVSDMPVTNLSWELYSPEYVEFFGKINFLKAGIISADVLSTVSKTYSREILEKEYGFGLEGLLRRRGEDLFGVMNGIDYCEWNPAKDSHIPANYDRSDMSGKAVCKREIVQALFRTSGRTGSSPLVGVVGRFSEQKGLDLVVASLPELVTCGARFAILGKGDERYHERFSEISENYADRVSVTIGFDEVLAHRIYAGSDFLLMPSKYEPCGLAQLISLRYGCIPVARRTGGLTDSVQDYDPLHARGTGFLFTDFTASAMQDALKRAFCVYTERGKMTKMRRDGMKTDFSWKRSARRYIELYKTAVQRRGTAFP